jgi:excisionase family DNA binding protein
MAYTTADAAKVAGLATVTIWRMVIDGRLPAQRVGHRGRIRIDPDVLALVLGGHAVRVV